MREFINQYIKLIASALTGLIFAYASFYLILNIYHQQEIARVMKVDVQSLSSYTTIQKNLDEVAENIKFTPNTYKGPYDTTMLLSMQGAISICRNYIMNDTFKDLTTHQEIGIVDIENFRSSFQNDVVNKCMIEQLYYFTSDRPILKEIRPFIKSNIQLFIDSDMYIKRDIFNNSSYFFNSDHTDNTYRSSVKDAFAHVMNHYKSASDFLLEVSRWYKDRVEER